MRSSLYCPLCERNFSGSCSKGNKRYNRYYKYYHCQTSGCKERFRVDIAHDSFNEWLQSIALKPEIAALYLAVMEDIYNSNEVDRRKEIESLKKQKCDNEDLLAKAISEKVNKKLDEADFNILKQKLNKEISELSNRILEIK